MLIPLGILASSGAAPMGDYELIQTTILGSNQASVIFDVSSFASTYKHLQIRAVMKTDHAAPWEVGQIRLNGDSGSNYSAHGLLGNGSSVSSYAVTSGSSIGYFTAGTTTANTFGGLVIDILDSYSTTKNKTLRIMSGAVPATSMELRFISGAWYNTASITSATLSPVFGTTILTGSRFSIYGIRG
jgi:hypothetical protein